MSWTWAEPFAGAAACALRLVGGRDLAPPVAWMGGKRRLARAILDAMGVPETPPARVLLADAGPWGWVWPLLLRPEDAAMVAAILRSWSEEHPRELWQRLAAMPPAENVHGRAAQWLWLQARSASGVPIWWDGWRQADPDEGGLWLASDGRGQPRPAGARAVGGRWEKGNEGRVQPAGSGQRGWAADRGDGTSYVGGMVSPATIAARIEALVEAFARVEWSVAHGEAWAASAAWQEAQHASPYVYLDPPYVGATGYGWDMPRAEVLALAQRWADAGAVVAVSEAEPLDLPGWHHLELTREGGKPEWLTLSRPPARRPVRQGVLFDGGAR